MASTDAAAGRAAVDAYLDAQPEPQQATLRSMQSMLLRILPAAHEAVKYGMPAVVVEGGAVAGYAGFKAHCSYFPMSSDVLTAAGSAVDGYPTSKGGLQFPVDRPLPISLVRRLVKLRLDEIADVRDGKRHVHFPDGSLKAVGPMRDGELHGTWRWYRADGSLLRTGRFDHGTKVGTWTTHERPPR
jgi:uncharacterized protein YdhG (YjbR/CyaY superfamily)